MSGGIDPSWSEYQRITGGSRRRRRAPAVSPYDEFGRMVPQGNGYDPGAGLRIQQAQGGGYDPGAGARIQQAQGTGSARLAEYNPGAGARIQQAQGVGMTDPYEAYRRITMGQGGVVPPQQPNSALDQYRRVMSGSGGQPPSASPYDEFGRMRQPTPSQPPSASPYDEFGRMRQPTPSQPPSASPYDEFGRMTQPGPPPPPIVSPYDERGRMTQPGPPAVSPGEWMRRYQEAPPFAYDPGAGARMEEAQGTGAVEPPPTLPFVPGEYEDPLKFREELIRKFGGDVNYPGYQEPAPPPPPGQADLQQAILERSMGALQPGNVFGQGDIVQAFGRPAQSGIEGQIGAMAAQLNTTAESEKIAVARNYQQQREKLARLYALDPSGRMSGQAQRDFEVLGAQEADAISAVDARIRDEYRQNIQLLTGVQESREGAALQGYQAQLQARQAAAGFLGQQQEQGLGQQRQDLASRAQLASEGQFAAQQQLANRQQDLAEESLSVNAELERARLAGDVDGVATLQARQQTLAEQQALIQNRLQIGELIGQYGGADTLEARRLQEQARQADNDLAYQAGTAIGQLGGQRTLAAQAADLQEQAFFADQLGYIHDPNSPTGYTQTLAGKSLAFDQAFQTEQFSESARQFNASFLGELIDPLTGQLREGLDAEQVRAGITQANSQLDLAQRQLNLDIGRTWAGITGTTGTPGPVTAADFGYDPAQAQAVPRQALPYTPEGESIREALRAMSGAEPSDDDIARIMSGEEVQVMGAPTLEAKRLGAEIMRSNLDRAVEYKRIADSTGIEWTRLNQAIGESDRQWALQTADVASRNDLDAEKFRLAKWDIEHQAGVSDEQLDLQRTETANRFGLDVARFNQAITEFDTQATLQAQQAQAQSAELANRYGLDVAQFNQGIDEFNAQLEIQRQQTQASIADTANRYGLDAARFNQAIVEYEQDFGLRADQTEAQTAELANRFGLDAARFNQAINEFGQQFELQQQQVEASIADTANRYGLDVARFNEASNEFAAQHALAQDQSTAQIADLANRFGLDGAKFNQAVTEYNGQYGLAAFQAQANVADVANRYGLDAAKFAEATAQFDQQYALQERQALQQLGITEEQWAQAKTQVSAQEEREKVYWDGLMSSRMEDVSLDWKALAGYSGQGPKREDVRKGLAEKGYQDLSDGDVSTLMAGGTVQVRNPRWEPNQEAGATGSVEPEFIPTSLEQLGIPLPEYNYVDFAREFTVDQRGTMDKYRNLIKQNTGLDYTDEEIERIIRGESIKKERLPTDWYASFSPEQRQEILALINGGQFATAQKGPGWVESLGGLVGGAIGTLTGIKLSRV